MAMLPCSLCHKRKPGPNHHFYACLLHGNDTQRNSLRLCADHADAILDLADPYRVDIETGEIANPSVAAVCSGCGNGRDGQLRSFFLTAYPRSQERVDYYAIVHADCRPPQWMETMLGTA